MCRVKLLTKCKGLVGFFSFMFIFSIFLSFTRYFSSYSDCDRCCVITFLVDLRKLCKIYIFCLTKIARKNSGVFHKWQFTLWTSITSQLMKFVWSISSTVRQQWNLKCNLYWNFYLDFLVTVSTKSKASSNKEAIFLFESTSEIKLAGPCRMVLDWVGLLKLWEHKEH